MLNDFKLTSPVTYTLDSLAICSMMINFLGGHEIIINLKDNMDDGAAISIVNGESRGLSYNAGVFRQTVVSTPTGVADAFAAMIPGGLPGLSAYLISSGLLVADGGIEVISPTP